MKKWHFFEEESLMNDLGENYDYTTDFSNFDTFEKAFECLNYEAKMHNARFIGHYIAESEEPDGNSTRCWKGSIRMIEM